MTDDLRQDYILRITQANATALVVVLYDMFLTYIKEAMDAEAKSTEQKSALAHTRACLSELIASLHREQELAGNFYQLYRYVERELIKAEVRQDASGLSGAESIMRRLRDAYAESVKDDASPALMQNTDVVYAGMTYGPGDVNISGAAAATNRGFWV